MRVEVLMEASGEACVYTGLDQRNFETAFPSISALHIHPKMPPPPVHYQDGPSIWQKSKSPFTMANFCSLFHITVK